jgi:hypothetical protein
MQREVFFFFVKISKLDMKLMKTGITLDRYEPNLNCPAPNIIEIHQIIAVT